jgi:hypothetical protein
MSTRSLQRGALFDSNQRILVKSKRAKFMNELGG